MKIGGRLTVEIRRINKFHLFHQAADTLKFNQCVHDCLMHQEGVQTRKKKLKVSQTAIGRAASGCVFSVTTSPLCLNVLQTPALVPAFYCANKSATASTAERHPSAFKTKRARDGVFSDRASGPQLLGGG